MDIFDIMDIFKVKFSLSSRMQILFTICRTYSRSVDGLQTGNFMSIMRNVKARYFWTIQKKEFTIHFVLIKCYEITLSVKRFQKKINLTHILS